MDDIWFPISALILVGFAVAAFVEGKTMIGLGTLGLAWQFVRLTLATLRDAGVIGKQREGDI